MNTEYLNEITGLLNNQKYQYQLLDDLNITRYANYKCFYLLIENKILYVMPIGETDGDKSQQFFKNLHQASGLGNGQKLSIILDTTQLSNIPSSTRKEVNYFNLSLRKYWSDILFINQGIGKLIIDMYELHKPEHVEGITRVNEPKEAVKYVLEGFRSTVKDDDLESLSKEELIAEVRRLRKSKENSSTPEISDLVQSISNLAWEKEKTQYIEPKGGEELKAICGLLNSIIFDFKELHKEHTSLQDEFYNKLKFQVGEVMHQEASLRSIFDSLDSIIWMVDADFNLMAFNNKFYHHLKTMYGITPEIGMNVLDYKELKETYDKTYERISKALDGKEESYIDFYRDGEQIVKVVDSKIFPVVLNEKIFGVACLTKDITESFEAEEKIKSNERIIASVNKNISEAIYRSSHEKGLIFINQAFVKMFGFESKEELYENNQLQNIYANPEDRERLGKLLIESKEMTNIEVQFRKKNGEVFTGLLSSMVSEDENGIRYFDGAIRDVTALKNVQEKLKRQNRELKKLNTELDSFVYSASHDLKAPLSSVKGLINLAKTESNKDQLAHYLQLADKSIDKLDDFIRDIVDLSRNARQTIKSEVLNFEELVQDTFDNYQYLDNFSKIERKIEVKCDVDFYSDKRRLKVIFNNLVSNAIRYYNPYLFNPYVNIKIKADKKRAVIEISDNGLGIEEQYLDKIFEMFYRASNHSKGTGIGLYIVKETLQKMKGEIKVESIPKEGTKFTVVLPNLAK
ncbi:PAS domain-containing sensor histidine kinase [Marivirga arenosa]|uniref:histidine kinase n=1 Tax=Marivirga arenosa TaxID=3059076 RepID=A0AA51N5I2_9BACT|nr:PAS domain-containing sensor histidine kinase [Marivirga sp. ABR2-2]WMN06483.1 PAS domain-containing sensor histidine kinase [Marivirga sp. ABR2-2]